MTTRQIIEKNFLRNFASLLILILFAGTVISASVLYLNIHIPLNTHYSAVLELLTRLKESLIIKTIKVNIFFIILIILGMWLLVLIYSHRIAGPLYRIRTIANSISQGNLNTQIRLRRKDAVNRVADSLNEMTRSVSSRMTLISDELDQIKLSIRQLDSEKGKTEEKGKIISDLTSADTRLKRHLGNIKLNP